MSKAYVFTDGGALGNPGEGAIGGVIYNQKREKIKEFSIPIGVSTNNQAEYLGLLYSILLCKSLNFSEVILHTDSELLYFQWKGIYRARNPRIRLYYLMVKLLEKEFKRLEVKKVPREKNREADRLVKKALKQYPGQTR